MGEWAKECGIKRAFSTLKDAERRLREIGKHHTMHGYKCNHCSMYHLGHKQPRGGTADALVLETSVLET